MRSESILSVSPSVTVASPEISSAHTSGKCREGARGQLAPTGDTQMAVAIALGAVDRPIGDALTKYSRRRRPASPCLAAGAAALLRLRRVDAVKLISSVRKQPTVGCLETRFSAAAGRGGAGAVLACGARVASQRVLGLSTRRSRAMYAPACVRTAGMISGARPFHSTPVSGTDVERCLWFARQAAMLVPLSMSSDCTNGTSMRSRRLGLRGLHSFRSTCLSWAFRRLYRAPSTGGSDAGAGLGSLATYWQDQMDNRPNGTDTGCTVSMRYSK